MKAVLMAVTILLAASVHAAQAPADDYAKAYRHGADNTPGLIALWNATPAVALIAAPNPLAVTTNYVWQYIGTNFVCSTTNVVQNSKMQPLSWNTTTWPWANAAGVPYGLLIITNPLTFTVRDIMRTGATDSVEIQLTNSTTTFTFSNIWVNVTGTSNGWLLVR